MNTTVIPRHLPALDPDQREQVGQELQATLLELIDLSLLGKQLHWSIVGLNFRSLHLQLDQLIDSWRELADTVAERAVAIGYSPDGQADAVAAARDHATIERGAMTDGNVVRELTIMLHATSERVRARMDALGELDLASQDVLIDVTRELEKHLWMVRVQMPNGQRR
jgi:starvation-inducible DNA-binding protein